MDAETPNQIIGVLAHETGHIAGGHLARMRENWLRPRQSILAMILGVGAMVPPAAAPLRAGPGRRGGHFGADR